MQSSLYCCWYPREPPQDPEEVLHPRMEHHPMSPPHQLGNIGSSSTQSGERERDRQFFFFYISFSLLSFHFSSLACIFPLLYISLLFLLFSVLYIFIYISSLSLNWVSIFDADSEPWSMRLEDILRNFSSLSLSTFSFNFLFKFPTHFILV